MNEMKQALLHRLIAISSVIPFTKSLQEAIEKDFKSLTANEGYELLRYLLLACGKPFDLNPLILGAVPWKDQLPDHKATIEKWKSDILLAAKNLLQKNDIVVKPLRKSDLIAPCNTRYFKSCISLAELAINHQLQNFGIKIDTKLPLSCVAEFQKLYNTFLQQEKELQYESIILQAQTENYLKETEELIMEINRFKKIKIEIDTITEEVIQRCPLQYRDALKDPSTRHEAITSWSKHLDNLCENNNNRELLLKKLDMNLKQLHGLIKGEIEQTCLDGNDMVPHISSELLLFANEKKIDVLDGDALSLLGLLKIFLLSLPHQIIDEQNFKKFLEFAYTPHDSGLFDKLQNIEEKIKFEINNFRPMIVNQTPDENWFKKLFETIPEIKFTNDRHLNPKDHQPSSSSWNSPFVDIEKLETLIKLSKNNHCQEE